MRRELKKVEHEKLAYIEQKKQLQILQQDKVHNEIMEELTKTKQELFEVKVRLEFIDKEKVIVEKKLKDKDG